MIFNRKLSINEEVFYLGLLSFVTILLVFGFLVSIGLLNISIENAKSSLEETTTQLVIFTEGYFSEITNTIEALSENPDIREAKTGNIAAKERALATYLNFARANENIAYIYSGYEDGLLLINDYIPEEGYDPIERPWYKAAMDSNPEASIGLPYREAKTDEWLLSQSKVLKDSQGNPTGVIAIDCSLDSITYLMSDKYIFDSQRSYILDENKEIILHSDDSFIGQTFAEIQNNVTDRQGDLAYTIDDRKVWAYYKTVDSTGWTMVTAVDRWEILGPIVSRILLYAVIVILLSFGLGILQSKIFGKRFAEPLVELGERIAAITEGKPIKKATYKYSNPEIEETANNIEQLTKHSLTKRANELKTIIESIQDGVLVVNDDREVIYINSRLKEMWQIEYDLLEPFDIQFLIEKAKGKLAEPELYFSRLKRLFRSKENILDTIRFKDGRILEQFSCPVINEGRIIGRLWSFRDITRRKQTEEKLQIMATTDELTGLYNRRFFMQTAREDISRAKRYSQPLSVIMVDIDHFKNINDTHGHAAGDAVLEHLASLIIKKIRKVDIAGRLGGEEFGVLLPNTGLQSGVKLAERLRRTIEDSSISFQDIRISVTASLGVASYYEGADIDSLLRLADKALYKAKSNGRNSVET